MRKEIQNKEYWDTLIIDRLSDNISEEDNRKLDAWLDESAKHLSYFNQMKDLWDSSAVGDPELLFDYERGYSLFMKRVRGEKESTLVVETKNKQILWRRIIAVAAVLIPVFVLGYYTSLYFEKPSDTTGFLQSEVVSPNGSKTQLRLADGTVVWLNSGSRLLYNDKFGKENRNLELVGEAYLDVRRNEQIPLVVKVGGLDIKVLGTKFNVNAYPEKSEVKVSLLEGSVSMHAGNSPESAILKPMETGVYQAGSNQITVHPGLDSNALVWMKNQLLFTGEAFEEIARMLERRFDVKINIHNDALRKRRFGGDFGEEESIDKVLKIMAVNGKFTYTMKNNVIEIY
ncbi:DUF4974 domain-containing protein [Parabacteroides sp. TM07-1AC]|uniref:FecR family protein n=1 Tax=Parabacteroides sp. TM07-1AC TaxID=2292363 RepID=UPI000EFE25ED|nr:FecR domain-containing protein [Parabacteroides sp. TM07-1AC]RHU22265.1 DUF4974 domain-containing protein [Parabacteroides sp. TM07-1AC]